MSYGASKNPNVGVHHPSVAYCCGLWRPKLVVSFEKGRYFAYVLVNGLGPQSNPPGLSYVSPKCLKGHTMNSRLLLVKVM